MSAAAHPAQYRVTRTLAHRLPGQPHSAQPRSMQDVTQSMISVEKSAAPPCRVRRCAAAHHAARQIAHLRSHLRRFAYSGVTNQLLEHKNGRTRHLRAVCRGQGLPGCTGRRPPASKLNAGFADLGLPLDVADAFIDRRIAQAAVPGCHAPCAGQRLPEPQGCAAGRPRGAGLHWRIAQRVQLG